MTGQGAPFYDIFYRLRLENSLNSIFPKKNTVQSNSHFCINLFSTMHDPLVFVLVLYFKGWSMKSSDIYIYYCIHQPSNLHVLIWKGTYCFTYHNTGAITVSEAKAERLKIFCRKNLGFLVIFSWNCLFRQNVLDISHCWMHLYLFSKFLVARTPSKDNCSKFEWKVEKLCTSYHKSINKI